LSPFIFIDSETISERSSKNSYLVEDSEIKNYWIIRSIHILSSSKMKLEMSKAFRSSAKQLANIKVVEAFKGSYQYEFSEILIIQLAAQTKSNSETILR
jgi:hypothetical protein